MNVAVARQDVGLPASAGFHTVLKRPTRGGLLPNDSAASSGRLDGLRGSLPIYRAVLERAWGPDTVHPAYLDAFAAGQPAGQCGVSSAWLAGQLAVDHGLPAQYCYGSLHLRGRRGTENVAIASHCWVEVVIDATNYVIDLTADQAVRIRDRIIFDSAPRQGQRGMRYEARMRKSPEDLAGDSIWPRLTALQTRIAATSCSKMRRR